MKLSILIYSILPILANYQNGIVPDRYIITMKKSDNGVYSSQVKEIENEIKLNRSFDNHINHHYENSLYGFSAKMDTATLERVRKLPHVAKISPVRMTRLCVDQKNATWGLARTSTNEKLGAAPYTFKYKANGGSGVIVYVVDTGVNVGHTEFEGRATHGTTIPKNVPNTDNSGHGTHCAGTVAGKTYGVAKKASIISVKVYDSNTGPDEDVLAGIEWVINHADKTKKNVMSLSLGTDHPDSTVSQEVVDAVDKAVDQGIVTVVAAGNHGQDACKHSPARSTKAITVGATTITDEFSSFSNFGKCVSILAPGSKITSAWIGNNTAINTISGTSMATPHISGLAAVLLSSGVAASDVKSTLLSSASKNKITGLPAGTPNLLGFYQN